MPKYGATGVHKIHSYFSTSGGVLSFYRDNASTQLAFGEAGTGLDVKFYGDTASAYVLWDESADTLEGASSATFQWDGTVKFAGAVSTAGAVGMSGSVAISGAVGITGADFNVTSASSHLGNASTDNIGFYGATATIQPSFSSAAAGIASVLVGLGLMLPS